MAANRLWKQFFQPEASGDLVELRRGTILEIAAVIFGAVWVMLIVSYGNPTDLVVPFVLLASSLGSVWLRRMDFRLALVWLVGTLIAAIACQKWILPDSPAQYGFPVVVVVSSLLVSIYTSLSSPSLAASRCSRSPGGRVRIGGRREGVGAHPADRDGPQSSYGSARGKHVVRSTGCAPATRAPIRFWSNCETSAARSRGRSRCWRMRTSGSK